MNTCALQNIAISQIVSDPQIRTQNGMEIESINELAASIKANGLLQPLLVRPNAAGGETFIVVAGNRRLAALVTLGEASAPCLVTVHESAGDALPSQLVENLQRVDLCLADLVQGVREVAESLVKPEKVSAMLGKSKSWVSKHLAVTGPKFNARAAELVTSGIVSDLEIAHTYHQIATFKCAEYMRMQYLEMMESNIERGTLTRKTAMEYLQRLKDRTADDDEADAQPERDSATDESEPTGSTKAVWCTVKMDPLTFERFEMKGGMTWLKKAVRE